MHDDIRDNCLERAAHNVPVGRRHVREAACRVRFAREGREIAAVVVRRIVAGDIGQQAAVVVLGEVHVGLQEVGLLDVSQYRPLVLRRAADYRVVTARVDVVAPATKVDDVPSVVRCLRCDDDASDAYA